jgi:hypothetical protein
MAKKKQSHVTRGVIKAYVLATIGIALIGLFVISHVLPVGHTTLRPQVIAVQQPMPSSTAKTPTTEPTVQPAPAPAPVAKSTTPTTTRTNIQPQPVVTPSPSSNVSGLNPVTSTAPSGGSSNTGGSSQTQASPPMASGYTSTNWSGYLAANSTYTAITGAWTVPNPVGVAGRVSADSAWIGIGGVTSSDLIQVGTQDIISSSGQVATSAFYELLPSAAQTIPNLTITPGDNVSAAITNTTGSQWTISITDHTNGELFNINVTYASSNSSAEWIEEDPSSGPNRLIPFDNYHTVTFSTGTTTVGGSALGLGNTSIAAQPVTMISQASGQTISLPSALSGNSFTTIRENF